MQTINLTSHFLIAMPAMSDPNFSRTLTFICEHNERGALGIVVNRPIDVTLATLLRWHRHRETVDVREADRVSAPYRSSSRNCRRERVL